jgi:hypothetical protein
MPTAEGFMLKAYGMGLTAQGEGHAFQPVDIILGRVQILSNISI